ncbi:DUF805 domain-containing protein [Microbacterium sp. NPDC090003]|uniref:DUF805 domain-containing protein n=1 Tax=Microbacterium sp. NPDC090003 TaxID=3364203 RepID=UPI00381FC609
MHAASAPLSQPQYRASLGQAVSRFFRKYATFRGRASSSEFWWAALFLFVVTLAPNVMLTLGVVSGFGNILANQVPVTAGADRTLVGYNQPALLDDPTAAALIPVGAVIGGILALALILPWLALSWRRLHDSGLVGAWYFLSLIPVVGGLFFLVLMAQPTKKEGRRFDVPV